MARGGTSQIIEAPFHGRPFSIEQGGDPCDDFIDNQSSALGIFLATVSTAARLARLGLRNSN